jgi:hypothetical protein
MANLRGSGEGSTEGVAERDFMMERITGNRG